MCLAWVSDGAWTGRWLWPALVSSRTCKDWRYLSVAAEKAASYLLGLTAPWLLHIATPSARLAVVMTPTVRPVLSVNLGADGCADNFLLAS